jgi:DNA-binding IclR family transcriptional regulator
MVSESSPTKKQRKPTAVTGLQIAEYLAKNPRGARLGDIATAVQMDTGQTHRIIFAMMEDGWVTSVSDGGYYAPTARVIGLGTPHAARLDLSDHAQPFLEDLFQKTGESVFLGELRNDVIVCVGRRLADRPLQVWTEIGKFWPLVGTAVGAAVCASKIERLGSSDAGAKVKVAADVASALKKGYARDSGHHRDGVECVAAAIRNGTGEEVGAISIGVPAARVAEKEIEKFGSLVCSAAMAISERLGWIGPDTVPKRASSRTSHPRVRIRATPRAR